MLEFLFNKNTGNFIKKRLQRWCFSVNIVKFFRRAFLQNPSGGCFCAVSTRLIATVIKQFFPRALKVIFTVKEKGVTFLICNA